MTLDRPEIARLLPHDGAMVLLDEVVSWSDAEIMCRTASHGETANPLRRGGILPAPCGIEYGAQAMALHGALRGGTSARPGVLASVRKLRWTIDRLDRLEGDLKVRAEVLMADGDRSIYAFALQGEGREIMAGQAAVFLL